MPSPTRRGDKRSAREAFSPGIGVTQGAWVGGEVLQQENDASFSVDASESLWDGSRSPAALSPHVLAKSHVCGPLAHGYLLAPGPSERPTEVPRKMPRFLWTEPPTGSQPSRAQKPALFSRVTVVSELSRGSSWSFSHWAPGAAPDRVSQATVMEANQWIMGRTEGRVSNWPAPGTESGEEALAGPDARRLGKDLHAASSSTGSSSVAASLP
jgi:hypothetical protein